MANDDEKFHQLRFERLRSDIACLIGVQVFQEDSAWSSMASTLVSSVYGSNWDRSVFVDVYRRATEVFSNCSSLNTNEALDSFLGSFRTLCQLFPSIDSLRCHGLPVLTKVRTISLPLYVSLLEGCYSNLARCILGLLAEETGRDYISQNKLRPMSDVLAKNGFNSLGDIPDVNLRNAINHGTVSLNAIGGFGCSILYTFTEQHESYSKTLSSGDLDHQILTTLDKLYASMLGILVVFEVIGIDSLFKAIDNSYIRDIYFGLQIGGNAYRCVDVQEVANSAQISYTFDTSETDPNVLFAAAESIISNLYTKMSDFDQYYVSFMNPRLPANFLRAKNSDVKAFVDGDAKKGELIAKIIKSGEVLWMGASDENINLYEAEYYRFPFHENEEMHIHDVEDASLSDRKRLKARLFIGQTARRAEIVKMIEKAVEWVASLYNPPSATIRIKHGDMKADCVYLNVYRNALDEDKSLFEKNHNFVCQVEYCPNAKFRLADANPSMKYLFGNSQWIDGSIRLLWRERKYLTIENPNKVGRNDPCPCGSGKKYKKCCGR